MATKLESSISANGVNIAVISTVGSENDYISLTDIAKYKNSTEPFIVVSNWLRSTSTIQFLGLWEKLNNPQFNPIDFDRFKNESGENTFTLSPQKWINATNAIGIISKSGRYGGGTFAHKDIAFEFASWVSAEFKLYIIQDYQRLKSSESHTLELDWNVKRILSKANYPIHTDAIKANLIPPKLSKSQQGFIYASEADLLNVALFGVTAKEWRADNPKLKGNMRDYASIEQLLVLINIENINALLIKNGATQEERLVQLRSISISQLKSLSQNKSVKDLGDLHNNLQITDK